VRSRRIHLTASHMLVALLSLVFLARAAVPAGWMPVFDASGVQLVLCDGQGPVRIATAHDHVASTGHPGHAQHHAPSKEHDGKSSAASGTCVFAATTGVPPQPQPRLAERPLATQPLLSPALTGTSPDRRLIAPPPPSTGPPTLI
jgi:hypothetical protein